MALYLQNTNRRLPVFAMRLPVLSGLIAFFLVTVGFSAHANDYSDLYESRSSSVVTIHTATSTGAHMKIEPTGLGSGVLIQNDLVMTAAHVVHTADLIMVKFNDGHQSPAEIVASVTVSDAALLKLTKPPQKPVIAPVGDSDLVRIGEPVFIIGAPFGIEQTLSVGNVSGRMNRGLLAGGEPIEFIQTDTAINQGNSGGPMFNRDGEVIGIVSFILSKSGGFNGIGFAVSINGARQSLTERSAFWTGFDGVMLNPRLASALNVEQGTGILVQHVITNSVAHKAGLRGGSISTKIEDTDIKLGGDIVLAIHGMVCDGPHNFTALKDQIDALDPNENFVIKVLRGGEIMDLVATVGELKNESLTQTLQ